MSGAEIRVVPRANPSSLRTWGFLFGLAPTPTPSANSGGGAWTRSRTRHEARKTSDGRPTDGPAASRALRRLARESAALAGRVRVFLHHRGLPRAHHCLRRPIVRRPERP